MWMGQSLEEKSRISVPSSAKDEPSDWKGKLVSNGQWLGSKVWQVGGNAVNYVRRDSHETIPDPVNDGRANWMASIRSGPSQSSHHMASSNPYQGGNYQQSTSSNSYGYQHNTQTGPRPGAYHDHVPIETFYEEPKLKKKSVKKKKKKAVVETSSDDDSDEEKPEKNSKKKSKKAAKVKSRKKKSKKDKKAARVVKESSEEEISVSSDSSSSSSEEESNQAVVDLSEEESEEDARVIKKISKSSKVKREKSKKKQKGGKKLKESSGSQGVVTDLLDIDIGFQDTSTASSNPHTASASPFDLISDSTQDLAGLTFSPVQQPQSLPKSHSIGNEPHAEPVQNLIETKDQYVSRAIPEGASGLVNLDVLVEASPEALAAMSTGPSLIEQQRIQQQKRLQEQMEMEQQRSRASSSNQAVQYSGQQQKFWLKRGEDVARRWATEDRYRIIETRSHREVFNLN